MSIAGLGLGAAASHNDYLAEQYRQAQQMRQMQAFYGPPSAPPEPQINRVILLLEDL